MSIIWKPTGSLDVSTSPFDLPDDGFKRCKNLRLGQAGKVVTRDGSQTLNATAMAYTPLYVIEQNGDRYTFSDTDIFKNEVAIANGLQCALPDYDNDGGAYAAEPTVKITCSYPHGAQIYYTTDGTDPTIGSQLYVSGILIPFFTMLKSIAVREGYLNSEIKSAYYSATFGFVVTETDTDTVYTETDNDTLITEGEAA